MSWIETPAGSRPWRERADRSVAAPEGLPLNQLSNVAVTEKLSALRMESYFEEWDSRADIPNAFKTLKRAGKGKATMKSD
ncbi:hypothetical protein NKJ90_18200 [Mesorhizobium sp. M0051]|uniref:hypothetical protein n=1 Tax=unclassified Mesorhizobium TaxID=325217 RepID=UPI00067EAEF6|nr:hypothetical protein [Mesorhizobium sp. LNHC252B00]